MAPQLQSRIYTSLTDVTGADLADDASDLFDRAGRGIDVGAALLGRQQMRPTEDVQRQIAVAVVIAVKEAPLLVPVQRVVGGVEVENDLLGRVLVRLEKQLDKQPLDLGRIPTNAPVAGQFRAA